VLAVAFGSCGLMSAVATRMTAEQYLAVDYADGRRWARRTVFGWLLAWIHRSGGVVLSGRGGIVTS